MGTYRQTLLHDFPTVETYLRGEARIDSDDLVTSSCSLVTEDVEECAPTGVHDALCQAMIVYHGENTQLWEGSLPLVLCSDHLKHAIVYDTRLRQASQKQAGLFPIHEKAILECSHENILQQAMRIVKWGMCILRLWHFTPMAQAKSPQAASW